MNADNRCQVKGLALSADGRTITSSLAWTVDVWVLIATGQVLTLCQVSIPAGERVKLRDSDAGRIWAVLPTSLSRREVLRPLRAKGWKILQDPPPVEDLGYRKLTVDGTRVINRTRAEILATVYVLIKPGVPLDKEDQSSWPHWHSHPMEKIPALASADYSLCLETCAAGLVKPRVERVLVLGPLATMTDFCRETGLETVST